MRQFVQEHHAEADVKAGIVSVLKGREDFRCIERSIKVRYDVDLGFVFFVKVALKFYQGETLFNNWESLFNGNGGHFNIHVPIYSFDGRNVMTDPSW